MLQQDSLAPDSYTIATMINAAAHVGMLTQAQQLFHDCFPVNGASSSLTSVCQAHRVWHAFHIFIRSKAGQGAVPRHVTRRCDI
jgi:hypothetical protein